MCIMMCPTIFLRNDMQVTTTDQETAEVGKEPLMTLGTFRSGKQLGWSALASWKHEVRFCKP